MVMKRDTSRVIQTILKEGSAEQKAEVQAELTEKFLEMCKNNYAHFIAMKMLKYGSAEEKSALIKKFHGHVREFTTHKVPALITISNERRWPPSCYNMSMLR